MNGLLMKRIITYTTDKCKVILLTIFLLCISTSALAVEPIDWSKTYALSTAIQAVAGAGGAAAGACTPDYGNTGGTGDRTASITITDSGSILAAGTTPVLVNGVLSENTIYFSSGRDVGTYLMFDFGVGHAKVITEAKFYQSGTDTHGNVQWSGSTDNSGYTAIGSSFSWGGVATQTMTELSANTTGYRYYRLTTTGACCNANPWIYEFEFKLCE
jgi:hypothetical protein